MLFDDIFKLMESKSEPRPLNNTDPKPITLTQAFGGPLLLSNGKTVCDRCHKIICTSYFAKHVDSGSCERNRIKGSRC
jgi:hypothetical protein